MMKAVSVLRFVLGIAGTAMAVPVTPEIDPGTGANALALLAGAVLLFRSRRSH